MFDLKLSIPSVEVRVHLRWHAREYALAKSFNCAVEGRQIGRRCYTNISKDGVDQRSTIGLTDADYVFGIVQCVCFQVTTASYECAAVEAETKRVPHGVLVVGSDS